jgi:hypothetical protein
LALDNLHSRGLVLAVAHRFSSSTEQVERALETTKLTGDLFGFHEIILAVAWGLRSKQFNYVHGDSHVAAAERKSLLLHIGAELAARGKLQLIF